MTAPAEEPRRFFDARPLKLDLGDMLVQIVGVALGVVIGFGVTAWNDRVRERALLHETVANIVDELRSNQAGMRSVEKDHAGAVAVMRATVASAHEHLSRAQFDRALKTAARFPVNVPLGIGWQIAQNDQGLTTLPYKSRYSLAWIYQLQTLYYDAEARCRTTLLTMSEPAGGNYYDQAVDLANQGSVVVGIERQLDGLYTEAIADAARSYHV